jgi:hypothetical protein
LNYISNSRHKSQASVSSALGCEGAENIPIVLSVLRKKKIYCSKAWRRIIPFGLSATRATKGGRRNIRFGLPIVRRKSQPFTFPSPEMMGIVDVTRHVTNVVVSRRELEND